MPDAVDKNLDKANDAAAKAADAPAPAATEPATHLDPAAPPSGHPPTKTPDAPVQHDAQSVVDRLADKLDDLQAKIRPSGPSGPTPGLSTTAKGGRFLVGGKLVDAHGRELNEDGSLKYPERQQTDAFGRVI